MICCDDDEVVPLFVDDDVAVVFPFGSDKRCASLVLVRLRPSPADDDVVVMRMVFAVGDCDLYTHDIAGWAVDVGVDGLGVGIAGGS